MARPRTCPNCLESPLVKGGYDFDQDGNLLCQKCGKILYPFVVTAEIEVDNGIKSRTTNQESAYRRYDPWNAGTYTEVNRSVSSITSQSDNDDAE